ncbi:MAG: right-handed parallel beta-helix repeat-containing protein, partial [Verrucomicrobiota bacterium]
MIKRILLLALFCSLGAVCSAQVAVHVAPDGDDAADGSEATPFATLEAARDRIRAIDASPEGGVVVWIHGGIYERDTSFELGKADSGTADSPIAYRSRPGQNPVFLFGKRIPTDAWKPISEAAARRVHPEVTAGHLFELDYDALGIQNGERLSNADQSGGAPQSFVLFADNLRQRLAQWPNTDERLTVAGDSGWATPNGTRDNYSFFFGEGGKPTDGSTQNELDLDGTGRSGRWKARLDSGNDLWLRGHWRTPWAPRLSLVTEIDLEGQWIRLASVPPGGMGSKYSPTFKSYDGNDYRTGSGTERYYAINLLEEIDRPGEYAIDFKDRRVYFYPPADLRELEITVADTDQPIVKASGAEYLQFD